MRVQVTLQIEKPTAIPLNYQHLLTGAVYSFLRDADADYAQFLHGEGYAVAREAKSAEKSQAGQAGAGAFRRFKLFTFSQLWAGRSRLDVSQPGQEKLWLQPGAVAWYVASPVEKFLKEFATGLLSCHSLQVGRAALPIAQVETLPPPAFTDAMHFKCLSPIVVGVGETSDGQRKTRYLRPKDPGWSERIQQNLLGKYAALYGGAPTDTRLALHFDPAYLSTHKGTKLITYKDIQMVGAFAPLTLSGSPDLIRIGYDCGLGEKNAGGCGMIEVVKTNG